jgi:D-beta-D-heptose 7-phosphate kinase/D-beta-D-heptose 1-phosphate adenosyltransferase
MAENHGGGVGGTGGGAKRSRKRTSQEKLQELGNLVERLTAERVAGRTVAFTNGCYDILHAGHLYLLEKASEMADLLVVGLNSDGSVRRLKGKSRPWIPLEDRARLMASLEVVDFVIGFEEDTPERLMEQLRPDVMIKGGDYTPETLPEKDTAAKIGCKVEIVPLVPHRSTTGLVERIVRAGGDGGK